MGLRDRVSRLEGRRADFLIVRVSGGMPEPKPAIASFGGRQFGPGPGEDLATFEARVISAARAAGSRTIVFGGLE